MKLRPQWRIVFSQASRCKHCTGLGGFINRMHSPFLPGSKARITCKQCKGTGKGPERVMILSLRKEYELQQKAMRAVERRRAL